MGRINRGQARKSELRERANTLADERSKRSAEQQIALLDKRLGEGKGAKKERAKLLAQIKK